MHTAHITAIPTIALHANNVVRKLSLHSIQVSMIGVKLTGFNVDED